ncbi:MAG: site-specific integrase [Gammaproteobacteria bacterium]|nr:site-specific integrase [Gammaproteobacteria bacterium]
MPKQEKLPHNIRLRGDLQYAVEIRRQGFHVHETFITLKQAIDFRDKTLADIDGGAFRSTAHLKKITFAVLIKKYMDIHILGDSVGDDGERRPKPSKKQDYHRAKTWLGRPIAHRLAAQLRPSDFVKVRDDRQKIDKKANNTIRLELAFAQSVFKTAICEWGMDMLDNPLESVKKPRGNRRTRRLLPHEEPYLIAALKSGRNPMMLPIVRFAIESAMRKGEIVGLTWDRVNLEDETISLTEKDTKTDTARTIVMTEEAKAILEALPRTLTQVSVFNTSANAITLAWPHVLLRARKLYEEDCVKAGHDPDPRIFNDFNFHDLRHEATSRLAARLKSLSVATLYCLSLVILNQP